MANDVLITLCNDLLAITAMPEEIAETLLHGTSEQVRNRFYSILVKKA
ncbi:hypothetical protein RUE5091_02470 [Ruegeria denitrificans]|uniref:Uncharacterized protein n=1 Tax=Ruegeria denitrificans TaxID=1715692 RepID=A0A0P1IBD1_9RHOB|nr:hypothetical protein [Ruegeria denitrificans]CUK03211.1 hypothetical protein RUE5091_02470 [Ruegeria denitrificans]